MEPQVTRIRQHTSQGETVTGHDRSASIIVLWVVQVVLAAMFVLAGGAKLARAATMVHVFGQRLHQRSSSARLQLRIGSSSGTASTP